MLACALADESIDRAAVDLNQFDFDQIKSDADPMLLPGALKYGGMLAFAQLCDSVYLCNATKEQKKFDSSPRSIEWLARHISELAQ